MKQTYKVTIKETLSMTVEVDAEDRWEAEQIVSDKWNNGEYILEAENFTGVEFHGQKTQVKNPYREEAR